MNTAAANRIEFEQSVKGRDDIAKDASVIVEWRLGGSEETATSDMSDEDSCSCGGCS